MQRRVWPLRTANTLQRAMRSGGNRAYPTMEVCMDKNRSDAADDLRAANCPRGVDSPRLESCLAEINAESCTGIGSGFNRSMACTKGALCP